jgi:hypothetical protein
VLQDVQLEQEQLQPVPVQVLEQVLLLLQPVQVLVPGRLQPMPVLVLVQQVQPLRSSQGSNSCSHPA